MSKEREKFSQFLGYCSKHTRKIGEFIYKHFGNDSYIEGSSDSHFHYPNFDDYDGFMAGEHTDYARTGYVEVSEDELIEFIRTGKLVKQILDPETFPNSIKELIYGTT